MQVALDLAPASNNTHEHNNAEKNFTEVHAALVRERRLHDATRKQLQDARENFAEKLREAETKLSASAGEGGAGTSALSAMMRERDRKYGHDA